LLLCVIREQVQDIVGILESQTPHEHKSEKGKPSKGENKYERHPTREREGRVKGKRAGDSRIRRPTSASNKDG